MAKFIAVDGEADHDGNYIIMCDSLGRTLYNPKGITSTEAFGFILSLPRKCEIVCYGLNYDANQWLGTLPKTVLQGLSTTHTATWEGHAIEWIPSKMITVTVPGKSVTVCEVFGFFQTSFVKALKSWGFDPPREMEVMKQRRGTFTQGELNRIVSYCQEECRMLVSMMERLQEACVQANCVPRRRWIGAGSIASSLLTKHHVRLHHAYDAELFDRPTVEDYVLRAYFGGRVELYRQGWHTGAYASDIRSAYPSAAVELPSLAGASVRKRKRYDPQAQFALWRVEWEVNSVTQIGPFPVRLPSGSICYPRAGSGVYHACEVAQARKIYGRRIRVLDGVIVTPSTDAKPFAWIPEVYAHRARFKAEGSYAEKALKLGLNSVYGKMAQGYGFGHRPPFQSYFWAGYVTARTRSKALTLLASSNTPVMCATDGVVTLDVQGDASDQLGGWETASYGRIATVQPGVYVVEHEGERFVKSRGFFARDVDYDQMLSDFADDPMGGYHFVSRRFIGLKVALHRKDFGVWRQWIAERRSVGFEVNNKRRVVAEDGTVLLFPPAGPYDSLPYVPKQSLYDDPTDYDLESMIRDDQPHREVD